MANPGRLAAQARRLLNLTLVLTGGCMYAPPQNTEISSISSPVQFAGMHLAPNRFMLLEYQDQIYGWLTLQAITTQTNPVTDGAGYAWYFWNHTGSIPPTAWIDDPTTPGKAVARLRARDEGITFTVHDSDLISTCGPAQGWVGSQILANCQSDFHPYILHVRAPSNCPAGQAMWAGFCLPDPDSDHIASGLDNCPNLANPDQANSDSDSLGDQCDPFTYPNVGQAIDFEGDYLMWAFTIPGATAYRIGLWQEGQLRYENLRDEGEPTQDLVLHRGSPYRVPLKPYVPTLATVEGLVNGVWSPRREGTIYLVPRKREARVLEIRYFPLSGGNINTAVTQTGPYTLAAIQTRVNQLSAQLEARLEEATRNPKHPAEQPYLDYRRMVMVEKQMALPISTVFSNPVTGLPFPNYFQALSGLPQNICTYVDVQGIRDVWIWAYTRPNPPNPHELVESNMAASTNFVPFLDVSNSYNQDDLPRCAHTYTVYSFEWDLPVGFALHSYGHQREALIRHADEDLYNAFVNPYGTLGSGTRSCGDVHYPPNAPRCNSSPNACACPVGQPNLICEYNYYEDLQSVPSKCDDWRPTGGAVSTVDCGSWDCLGGPDNVDHDEERYQVWWAQRIPGRGTTVEHGGVRLRNWHELLADFDTALLDGGLQLTE